jgi:hypothetical protein
VYCAHNQAARRAQLTRRTLSTPTLASDLLSSRISLQDVSH